MANRTVYGNTFSSNGWPMVDEGSCQWVTVPGTDPPVGLQIQQGQPVQLLRAFAADFHAYVQPLRDADSACWTLKNDVDTSNHLSGTACDFNWNSHEFRVRGTFTPEQLARLRALLDWYEGMIFWGGDWTDPVDEMHFQLASLSNGGDINTYGNPDVDDFIKRKIRADGFSTYGREPVDGAPDTPSEDTTVDPIAILAAATGLSTAKCAEILPTLAQGMELAQCNTVNRIAMFIAQTQEESDNYNATEEYASGAEYEGRVDLGNTQPGDGVRFKGRTWIQITGRSNYAAFSRWAFTQGLVPSPTYFVDHPTELSDTKWAGIGAAWYWTVQRPQINSLCDARDINGVTYAINGGYTHLDVRTANWNRALAQGDALLALGDDMFTDADRDLLRQVADYRRPSRSPLRWPHQGDIETCAGFAWNADAFGHVMQTEKLAVEYGDSVAIANLYAVATTDEPGRDADKALATKILEKCDPTALALAGNQIAAWLAAEQKAKAA